MFPASVSYQDPLWVAEADRLLQPVWGVPSGATATTPLRIVGSVELEITADAPFGVRYRDRSGSFAVITRPVRDLRTDGVR